MIFAIVAFWSCEKPVTVNIPEKPPRIIINGWLGEDSVLSVHVGKSRYSLAPDVPGQLLETYTVKNAVPVIFENNIPIDTLVYKANEYKYTSVRNKKIRGGYNYVVKVNAPNFTEALAETIVPSQVALAGVQRIRDARTNPSGFPEDEIIVRLNDAAAEENFYLIQVYGRGYYAGPGYPISCVRTTDKDIEILRYDTDPMDPDNCFDGDQLLMKDVHFNGGQKVLRLYVESSMLQEYVNPGTGHVARPYIHVYQITKDHFKFLKSFNLYWSTEDNPFAEPVNVFSNVRNGYGVFSAYTKVVDTLR